MNWSQYFYENWLDKLVTIIGVLIGIVSAVGIVLSKVMESLKGFKCLTEAVKEKSDKLDNSNLEIENYINEIKSLMGMLDQTRSEAELMNKNYVELKEKLGVQMDNIKGALYLAFMNDANLVKGGYAKQIAELIGESETISLVGGASDDKREI